jgi:hypothetical protein
MAVDLLFVSGSLPSKDVYSDATIYMKLKREIVINTVENCL